MLLCYSIRLSKKALKFSFIPKNPQLNSAFLKELMGKVLLYRVEYFVIKKLPLMLLSRGWES